MTSLDHTPELLSLVYYSFSGPDALSVLRFIGPAKMAGYKLIYGVEKGNINVGKVKEGDIILLQRDICRHYDLYEKIVSLARAQRKPIVFDLDDLLFELPENHPDRISGFYTEALLPMLQAVIEADLVTVASETLKEYLLPYNKNIEVIPNHLNDQLWDLRKYESPPNQDDIITIGYMGGQSHQPDLSMILPVLRIIRDKYWQKVRFHFWGIEPPNELQMVSLVDWCPPPTTSYADFVKYFQTQHADIVIAPLRENLFNSCKSSIKYLEYSANAMPGVYSNVKPYADIIANREDGFLASSINDWIEMISSLIESRDLRTKLINNSQSKVANNWLLSQNYQRQFELYQDLANQAQFGMNEIKPPMNIFRNLSKQYYEHLEKSHTTINSLTFQVEEQQTKINDLKNANFELTNEILSCVLSKSWTYTRPFRKINTLIKKVF